MLLLDGYSSHYQSSVVHKAAENDTVLFCLPPHTTHLAQLSRTCFSPLKQTCNEEGWLYVASNSGKKVNQHKSPSYSRGHGRKQWHQAILLQDFVLQVYAHSTEAEVPSRFLVLMMCQMRKVLSWRQPDQPKSLALLDLGSQTMWRWEAFHWWSCISKFTMKMVTTLPLISGTIGG